MEKIGITIIGAGVVGLAIASRLSKKNRDIFVIEREDAFGKGISSRNSEVIHAGLYYPPNSLKSKVCVEGNVMLYELCQNNSIPFKKSGKLIVATNNDEIEQIRVLHNNGNANGVEGLKIIESKNISKFEPNIAGICALYSPVTGIIDTHRLMQVYYNQAKSSGVNFIFNSEVIGINRNKSGYEVKIRNRFEENSFNSRIVINSAGLDSDSIAGLIGMDIKKLNYDLKYCKGQYFRLNAEKSKMINGLVYPVPQQTDGGLGIHLTPDLSGQVRLGPDAIYLNNRIKDYEVDRMSQSNFYESVKFFAPFINESDISVDTSGIRPKLQGEGEGFRDFVIKEESYNGFPGFINLIGIESPGLTGSPSIARLVEEIVERIEK